MPLTLPAHRLLSNLLQKPRRDYFNRLLAISDGEHKTVGACASRRCYSPFVASLCSAWGWLQDADAARCMAIFSR